MKPLLPLLFLVPVAMFLVGCSSAEINQTMADMNKSMNEFIYGKDKSVTPENKKSFEQVPFEKATNRAFYDTLKEKKLVVSALYMGTIPEPGKLKRVEDYVNLKMCDVNKRSICTDTVIINKKNADSVFALKENQQVRVYGALAEPAGVSIGTTGQSLNFKDNYMQAPTIFFEVYKIE